MIYGNYNNYNNYSNQNQVVAYNQNNNNMYNNNNSVYNKNYGNYQQNNTMYNQQNNSVFYNNYRMSNQNNLNNMNNGRLYNSYQNLNNTFNLNNTNYNYQNNLNNMNSNSSYNNYQNYNYGMNTNFNNNYRMTMSNPYLNTSYQNQNNYNTMFNNYPNTYNAYQNNFNNLQSNPMGYTQGFYNNQQNNQQIYNKMEIKKIQSDEEIVKEILNCRMNLENLGNQDEDTITKLYYEETINVLNRLKNNSNNDIILDNNDLDKLLYIVESGYEEYKQLYEIHKKYHHKRRIIQMYVLLKILQKSQDIGKNSYFGNALRSITSIKSKNNDNEFEDDSLGSDFSIKMDNLNTKQKNLLTVAIGEKITDQDFKYLDQKIGNLKDKTLISYQYNINNQQKLTNKNKNNIKLDEEIVEEILKFRKNMEKKADGNTDEITNNYYEEIANILSNILKDSSRNIALPTEDLNNLSEIIKTGYEQYKNLSSYSYCYKYRHKEIIKQIYVLLKFLQESQDIGKNINFINALKSIKSINEKDGRSLGEKSVEEISKLNANQVENLSLAVRENISDEDIKNIMDKAHIKRDREKIEKDQEIAERIVEKRRQIEGQTINNKLVRTNTYYRECISLLDKIYSDPNNLVLDKEKIRYYKSTLTNSYNIYLIYLSNSINYSSTQETIRNLEKNFIKMFVFLSFIFESENLGRNEILINEVKKMDSATIETTQTDKIMEKLINEEIIIMAQAFYDFDTNKIL